MSEFCGLKIDLSKLKLNDLLKVSEFIAEKNKFSEEMPLIAFSCANDSDCYAVTNFLSAAAAASGAHSAILGKIGKALLLFAIPFINADCGVYIEKDNLELLISMYNSKGKPVSDIEKAFDFSAEFKYKTGLFSNYSDIIERLIK